MLDKMWSWRRTFFEYFAKLSGTAVGMLSIISLWCQCFLEAMRSIPVVVKKKTCPHLAYFFVIDTVATQGYTIFFFPPAVSHLYDVFAPA